MFHKTRRKGRRHRRGKGGEREEGKRRKRKRTGREGKGKVEKGRGERSGDKGRRQDIFEPVSLHYNTVKYPEDDISVTLLRYVTRDDDVSITLSHYLFILIVLSLAIVTVSL